MQGKNNNEFLVLNFLFSIAKFFLFLMNKIRKIKQIVVNPIDNEVDKVRLSLINKEKGIDATAT